MFKLDKFFLKYEGGGGGGPPPPHVKLTHPQEKLPSKSPALLGLKTYRRIYL